MKVKFTIGAVILLCSACSGSFEDDGTEMTNPYGDTAITATTADGIGGTGLDALSSDTTNSTGSDGTGPLDTLDALLAGSADKYVAGLKKEGINGQISVYLVQSDPIPKDVGLYTWTIEVIAGSGAPIDGAIVTAEPRMPAHDHGTFPPFTDGEPTGEPGEYALTDMDLFMPGVWEVTLRVTTDLGIEDEVAFRFDLDG